MEIKYYKPNVNDIESMQKLVQSEVDSGTILLRTPEEMATTIRSYTAVKADDKLVGFVALHIHSPTLAEIRSLIVDPEFRAKGIGKGLVKACIEEAKDLGISELLVLTYKKMLFESFGFSEIPKESIPEHKIWADCIRCKHFPICDEISLIKYLE